MCRQMCIFERINFIQVNNSRLEVDSDRLDIIGRSSLVNIITNSNCKIFYTQLVFLADEGYSPTFI